MNTRSSVLVSKCKAGIYALFPTILFTHTVFVFSIFELYLSNKDFFFFGGDDLIPFSLILFLLFTVLIFGIIILFSILNQKISSLLITIVWATAFALYVQGNFVLADYGIMDGTPIDWGQYSKQGIISVTVFVLIYVMALLCIILFDSEKSKRIICYSSAIVILVQIVTLTVLLITNNGLLRPEEYVATTNDEFNLSKDENFIILMLDSFDSQALSDILNDDCAADYTNSLENFTYYSDTTANYAFTDLAFPSFLSGELYYNDEPYGSYLNRAYTNSPLINRLKKDNWFCGIYTTSLFADNETSLRIDNCVKIKRTVSSHKRLAMFMYRLAGFRYLIQPLKQYCWFYPDDMRSELVDTGISGVDTFDFDNFLFYYGIDEMHTDMSGKSFHLYHIDGTHPPYDISPDFIDTNADHWEVDGLNDEARAMMNLISKFINKLKELDVYDNSTIIICADHGLLQVRQSPIFLVKGKSDSHSFVINSNKQLSYDDLQTIFANILSGKETADTIVDIPDGDRKRIYKYYEWNTDLGYDSYARDLIEYQIYGYCRDMNNVIPTGNIYIHTE